MNEHSALDLPKPHITTPTNSQGLAQWIQGLQLSESGGPFPEPVGAEEERPKLDASTDSLTTVGEEEQSPKDLPLNLYHDIAIGSSAFEWLLSRVNRLIEHRSSASAQQDISSTMSDHLLRHYKRDGEALSKPQLANFELRLDLRGFLAHQVKSGDPSASLPEIVTITGAKEDAQAMTCAQYLATTWPITGHQLMRHLDALLRSGSTFRSGGYRSCNVPFSHLNTNNVVQTHWRITQSLERPCLRE
jgi:hypothetical protein